MRMPDGSAIQLKVRSLVGLLPLCAATVFDGELLDRIPQVDGTHPGRSFAPSPTPCRRWHT